LRARDWISYTYQSQRLYAAEGLWGRFMGLMGRKTLAPDAGLWLSGTNGIHMMFMRFSIDAVFLSRPEAGHGGAQTVLSVHRGLRAWVGLIPLVRGAYGVLELPVGTIERTQTAVGDLVSLEDGEPG
jgi:uncharacterized membrane protein (UPF0127 family)